MLAEHDVDTDAAARALQSLFLGIGSISAREFGTGNLSVEVVTAKMMDAALDAACILSTLGLAGTDLEFRVGLPRPEDRRWRGCLHEAAHAVAAGNLLGWSEVTWISVHPSDLGPADAYGMTRLEDGWSWIQHDRRRPSNEVLRSAIEPKALALAAVTLAGAYGVGVVFSAEFPSWGSDLAAARNLCTLFEPEGEEESALRTAHATAARVVGENRASILRVAGVLAAQDRLTGDDVERIALGSGSGR